MTNAVLSIEQKYAISDLIQRLFGLFFPPERFADMLRALSKAALESGFDDEVSYAVWLLSKQHDEKQLEPLITNLTIGETYFFRDSGLFSGLEKVIFPAIAASDIANIADGGKKTVRIWSAACSTGEEAYSLAILLDQVQPFSADWQIKLHATDVNVKSLTKARNAVYSQWSFRGIDPQLKSKYFNQYDQRHWQLKDAMRQRVDFTCLNLASHPFKVGSSGAKPFDIILCRNVLMYFSAQLRSEILHSLTARLKDGGWLMVSPSEVGLVDVAELTVVDVDGMLMHRKTGAAALPMVATANEGDKISSSLRWQGKKLRLPVKSREIQSVQLKSGKLKRLVKKSLDSKKSVKKMVGSKPLEVQQRADVDNLVSPPAELSVVQSMIAGGNYAQAIDELLALLESLPRTAPERVAPSLLLGRCLANSAQLEEAQQWVEQALLIDRLNCAGYYLLATLQQEQGDLIAAQKSLEQALFIDADYIMANFALGMLLCQGDNVGKARGAKLLLHAKYLLEQQAPDTIVPDSEQLAAQHLLNIVDSII